MNRTTIMLPPDLKARAERRARDRGISLGELIRQSLATALTAAGTPRLASDPLFADDATWDGDTPPDLSAEHDRYLYGVPPPSPSC